MNWNNIISGARTSSEISDRESRTDYQRDFDRIVFSSAFRRLQNKTQIFPLPGATLVHNRLTHSLEVASVGRSLGNIIGRRLIEKKLIDDRNLEFYRYDLQNVIASACLAHDIGNPSFGHSGEEAISKYFIENESNLKNLFTPQEWFDLTQFEGNANSFRILTHQFNGKPQGGYRLTYSTLASMVKYPCLSDKVDKSNINTKKFNFFLSEQKLGFEILDSLNISKVEEGVYKRHPFVYLTEAADDICYKIVDFEDAQRLNILNHSYVKEIFMQLMEDINKDDIDKIHSTLKTIKNNNEQISYLRAKCINRLTLEATEEFIKNAAAIESGEYNQSLLKSIENNNKFIKEIDSISLEKIYNHDTVIQLEIAGFEIMSKLLALFVPAVLSVSPNKRDEKVLRLLPEQYQTTESSNYHKVMTVLDFLSGMTDEYAFELYRKLYGIEIPKHRG